MNSKRALRVYLITFMFILSSILSIILITPHVNSEPLNGRTTFYFKDIFYSDEASEFGSGYVSLEPPTKNNDSVYPPVLFKNGEFNADEFLAWSTFWLLANDTIGDYLGEFGGLIPGPLKILEIYEFPGGEPQIIKGDVSFNLYFLSNIIAKNNIDQVKVQISSMNFNSILPIPILKGKSTVNLTPNTLIGGKIHNQEVIIKDFNETLTDGEQLLFSIELIPSNKSIFTTIENIIERPTIEMLTELFLEWLENQQNNSGRPAFQQIGIMISTIKEILGGLDISPIEVINAYVSTSIVYDSVKHPSSVTLPFSAFSAGEETNKIYYLQKEKQMNEKYPTSTESSIIDLSNQVGSWNTTKLNRSQILKSAYAKIYFQYKDPNYIKEEIQVTANLKYKNDIIAKSNILLEKNIINLIQPTETPLIFNFDEINTEIDYGKSIELEIKCNKSDITLLRSVNILYDSEQHPSQLSATYTETDNIQMTVDINPLHEKVVPGGGINYNITINSLKEEDNIKINISEYSKNEKTKWYIDISKEQITIPKDNTEDISIKITSSDTIEDGDKIDIKINAIGKTGKDTYNAIIEVSEEAVEYEIGLTTPVGKTIRHGKNDTYKFNITNQNTGIWSDSYQIYASSEHDFNLTYEETIQNLLPGESKILEITILIPEGTNISSDKLYLTVTSINGNTFINSNITSKIIGPNIFEEIHGFFKSMSKDFGLDDIFGDYGAYLLIAIIFIAVFFILLIILLLITAKSVKIICLDRIKEINPNEEAKFELKITNPTKNTKNYEAFSQEKPMSPKWESKTDKTKITLEPKKSKNIILTVKPTSQIEIKDWIEVDLVVNTVGKQKLEKLTTMTMIKDAKPELELSGIFHWPKIFKKGEKIITSLRLDNKGSASTKNINVTLYVNNKQKNKVEDIVIPGQSYADIRIPWIASKGKNDVNIIVN